MVKPPQHLVLHPTICLQHPTHGVAPQEEAPVVRLLPVLPRHVERLVLPRLPPCGSRLAYCSKPVHAPQALPDEPLQRAVEFTDRRPDTLPASRRVELSGLEPPASSLRTRRSSQLSYSPKVIRTD